MISDRPALADGTWARQAREPDGLRLPRGMSECMGAMTDCGYGATADPRPDCVFMRIPRQRSAGHDIGAAHRRDADRASGRHDPPPHRPHPGPAAGGGPGAARRDHRRRGRQLPHRRRLGRRGHPRPVRAGPGAGAADRAWARGRPARRQRRLPRRARPGPQTRRRPARRDRDPGRARAAWPRSGWPPRSGSWTAWPGYGPAPTRAPPTARPRSPSTPAASPS